MGDDAATAGDAPAATDLPANNDAELSDDELLAQLDEEFETKRENEDKAKPKGKDKPEGKPRPKDKGADRGKQEKDDDEDDDEDDQDEPAPKGKGKQERERKGRQERDERDDPEGEAEEGEEREPRLHPKTPDDVKKLFGHKWKAYRETVNKHSAEHKAAMQAVTDEKANFHRWVKEDLSPRLQPAVKILKMIEAYKAGDYATYAEILKESTGESLDISTKKLLHGTKESPDSKRLRAELAERDKRLAELERRLEEQGKAKQGEQQRQTQEQAVARYCEQIRDELDDHPVTKLKGFERKVLAVQKKSYDPTLKAFRVSIEQAADKVVRIERRRLEELKALEEDEPAPKVRERQERESTTSRVFSLNRAESREGGAVDEDESDEEILADLDRQLKRSRREERKKGKGKR
jgi:hypothetical protein